MASLSAVYIQRDHRDVVVRSWVRQLPDGAGGTANWEACRALGADLTAAEPLAVVHTAPADALDAEAIARALARFPQTRASAVFARVSRGRDLEGKRSLSLSWPFGRSQRQWRLPEEMLMARAAPGLAEFTFIYRDWRDGSAGAHGVFLPSRPESTAWERALADFTASEEWWEPVALFPGSVRVDFLSEAAKAATPPPEPPKSRKGAFAQAREVNAPAEPPPSPENLTEGAPSPKLREPEERPDNFATKRDVGDTLADILVRAAVDTVMAAAPATTGASASASERFRAFLIEKRPLILLETVHFELASNITRAISALAGLRSRVERRAGGELSGPLGEGGQARVVLFERSTFERAYNEQDKELDNRLRQLARQGDIGLVVTDSIASLPAAFRLNRDLELRLPNVAGPLRQAVLTSLYGPDAQSGADDDSWSRYASALDFEKVAYSGARGRRAVADLAERVRGRLQRMGATKGLQLSDIHGLGAAKAQAQVFITDLESYLGGRIPWSEVDRGMLMVGPPGTGKTMLAKAISKETGVRFIHGSASEWQASSHLGEHIQAIRNTFSLARRYAPSILFIDEFDSIGRRGHGGQNEFYHTAVVNCVLEELQGFEEREGVVVIAATNRVEGVDPALRRAGRLDRVVELHYPTIDALEKIYAYYVGEQSKAQLVHGPLDLKSLARMTFGQTGADVELYVRGAARRARGRAVGGGDSRIVQEDFIAEIMKSPIGESGGVRLSEDEMRRTAVHESGHAVVQLAGPTRGANISFLSITPRADGTLGFVFTAPDERMTRTRGELRELVRVMLGGRAAESIIYGESRVSSGAGGPNPGADLAQATRLLTSMITQYGFSRRGGLLWRRSDSQLPQQVEAEVARELRTLYGETLTRVRRNRRLLNKVVKILLDRQEVTGAELKADLGRRG